MIVLLSNDVYYRSYFLAITLLNMFNLALLIFSIIIPHSPFRVSGGYIGGLQYILNQSYPLSIHSLLVYLLILATFIRLFSFDVYFTNLFLWMC